ncbi:NADP-dependent isocitrate dehydrogenase [Arcanobacterium phocae]|uniref:NADP-dependent isocitrate dehydrogenase n=1 Tax=Arcanobacterium phocae TaxID=131112 RepID=UPI001C0F3536|nr:NADP-dependent isocitrate dehydrogenase [Arcanobacterium phocae]
MTQIFYTHTDESPMLASTSLLPIVSAFAKHAHINITSQDISLAGRIISAFSDRLPPSQQRLDALAQLSALTRTPAANIVKLPNISASLPQLIAAINELQEHGIDIPLYPAHPTTSAEHDVRKRYDSVLGSAVNPVLREGNSDRRAPRAVKNFARSHPHRMEPWPANSQTTVTTMKAGDFKHTEKSVVVEQKTRARIVFTSVAGQQQTMTDNIELDAGDILDASIMEVSKLRSFLSHSIAQASSSDLLFSLHLKATMMKVSDPVIFGHTVRAFFPQTFTDFGPRLTELGLHADDGLTRIFAGLDQADDGARIRQSFDCEFHSGARLSMVDAARGITNLHVPSDVIIDASMPAMIRNGGKLWGPDGELSDTIAVIPDSSYADVYRVVIQDCQRNGAFDPATMGSVSNVGLMAQRAEEYGSHDKTFVAPDGGRVDIVSDDDIVLVSQPVYAGDIFRGCVTKKAPIMNWVQLALSRARYSDTPVIFWLDPERAHDRLMTAYVHEFLADEDTDTLDVSIMSIPDATKKTLGRLRAGLDTISATGNVLRDYLTDLFPIMELGTSAKMLSVVPLMAGGGMFETGAGGTAPKLTRQLLAENHLQWDSLGEFLAVSESLRHVGRTMNNRRADILADTLDYATEQVLANGYSPQAAVRQLDSRGSHAWLATYWAQALAHQPDDTELARTFAKPARLLEHYAADIQRELLEVQGKPVDLGGYYDPDPARVQAVMRPSARLNSIIDHI